MPIKSTVRFSLVPSIYCIGDASKYLEYIADMDNFTPVFYAVLYPEYIEYSPNMGDFGGKVKQIKIVGEPIIIGAADAYDNLNLQLTMLKEKLSIVDEAKLRSITGLPLTCKLTDL